MAFFGLPFRVKLAEISLHLCLAKILFTVEINISTSAKKRIVFSASIVKIITHFLA